MNVTPDKSITTGPTASSSLTHDCTPASSRRSVGAVAMSTSPRTDTMVPVSPIAIVT
jgi:hypothetical protein